MSIVDNAMNIVKMLTTTINFFKITYYIYNTLCYNLYNSMNIVNNTASIVYKCVSSIRYLLFDYLCYCLEKTTVGYC